MAMVAQYSSLSRPTRPLCSVCIANYNGVALLADCLDSVLAQNGDLEFEIIVHDDASTDGSVAWLRERYPQIELLASKENVGFCVSNNRMVEYARGEFVLLLNNDAALFPDALATLRRCADQQTPKGILTLPQYNWQTGELVDRGCLLDPFCNPVPNLDAARVDVAMVPGAGLWIPRAAWNELGGFPEWIESIGEDLFLCCQARLRGLPVQTTRESGYRHWQGKSFGGNKLQDGQLQSTFRRRRLSERNKTAVLFVTTPGPLMWPLLALHLTAMAMEGLLVSMINSDVRIWKEIYWPAITLPLREFGILRTRRGQLQSTRRGGLRIYLQPVVFLPQKILLLLRHGMPKIR